MCETFLMALFYKLDYYIMYQVLSDSSQLIFCCRRFLNSMSFQLTILSIRFDPASPRIECGKFYYETEPASPIL